MVQVLKVLPAVNAVLISASGLFILAGVRSVRRGDRLSHQRQMLAATGLASLFLVLYLTRLSLGGLTAFMGPVWVKTVYLAVLASHIGLAVVSAPMVLVALWRAFHAEFAGHRRIARIAYPIWLYVSATGVLVYSLLHFPY